MVWRHFESDQLVAEEASKSLPELMCMHTNKLLGL
jgi:hypothetical protein